MTLRPVIIADATAIPRPSARVGTVAKMLEGDPSQVRKMVRDGQLEAHRVGKRGIRVFLDSVAAWQAQSRVAGHKRPAGQDNPQAQPAPASRAAHRQAMAHLQALGLV